MNENILIVEHRSDLLERFVDLLRDRHYNPISTKSRSQAVNISNESTLDLILLDADIGDSQGLQLLDTFKNQEATKGTPIILLSTPYRKMEFIEEALNLGIDGLIFIPFDEMELIVRVNGCLKYRKLYLEYQKLIKQTDYLQNSLNDMTEASNRNYQSYKEIQKKYDEILNVDLETGLWNKKEFYEQFTRLLYETVRHEETIVLACFSIDGLESIINEFGIIASEEIMLKFTNVLKKSTVKEDIIARFDNNEFIVAFNRMSIKLYDSKIQEIRKLVDKNELEYNGVIIKYTISVGISYTVYKKNYHIESIDKEIAPVLLALHNAKRRGFASLFIHPTIIKK